MPLSSRTKVILEQDKLTTGKNHSDRRKSSYDAHPRFNGCLNANERPLIVILEIVPTQWESCFVY